MSENTQAPRPESAPPTTRMRVTFARPGAMTVTFDQAPVENEERR
ncbi:hypothetical protein [Nocardia mexicana]|uniref:Uncharacterized protein n=1 Tax=Nocardia mexicana TaxID=279262 RepID=A0A370GXB0_9NOCA|nr:hypothetical protein [Nocardia mexicana]RDI47234.1 hypothetical protein DFR68_109233 [Nocardia mexicana]